MRVFLRLWPIFIILLRLRASLCRAICSLPASHLCCARLQSLATVLSAARLAQLLRQVQLELPALEHGAQHLRAQQPLWVHLAEQLLWTLPELVDLRQPLRLVQRRHVHAVGLRVGVEDVAVRQHRRAALLVPEDEVDPLVQVVRHVLALQRVAHHLHELLGRRVRPRRQHHVRQHLVRQLPRAQRQPCLFCRKIVSKLDL